MKKIYSLFSFILLTTIATAQIVATTSDGRKVILFPNGTWKYASRQNTETSSDFMALYNESYKYAYEVLYADEFFTTERTNKALSYAQEYVAKNLYATSRW